MRLAAVVFVFCVVGLGACAGAPELAMPDARGEPRWTDLAVADAAPPVFILEKTLPGSEHDRLAAELARIEALGEAVRASAAAAFQGAPDDTAAFAQQARARATPPPPPNE